MTKKKPRTVRMTEARLNDCCYILLKKAFFEPVFNAGPRQGDIRICMDMAAPERITSIMHAIISPNEQAGASHDTWYEVDPAHIFDVVYDYLVDHWRAEGGIFENRATRLEARRQWVKDIFPVMMETPEEACGVEEAGE
jgi:hypothetical protein